MAAFRSDGSTFGEWPVRIATGLISTSPAIGDIDGDGLAEIVVRGSDSTTREDTLHVYSSRGEPVAPWPVMPGTLHPHSNNPTVETIDQSPVLGDLDADGDLEILIGGDPADPTRDAAVLAFQGDGSLWASYGPPGEEQIKVPPAVGDVDADGALDVVMVSRRSSGSGHLTVWRADGTALTPSPVSGGASPWRIVLADLDGDEDLEIVVPTTFSWVQGYHHDGTHIPGWSPARLPTDERIGSVAIADMTPADGSDTPQVLVSIFKNISGSLRHGLRVLQLDGTFEATWLDTFVGDDLSRHQPVVGDIDDDGIMEVLLGPSAFPRARRS